MRTYVALLMLAGANAAFGGTYGTPVAVVAPQGWFPPIIDGNTILTFSTDFGGAVVGCSTVSNGILQPHSSGCRKLEKSGPPIGVTPAYPLGGAAAEGGWLTTSDLPVGVFSSGGMTLFYEIDTSGRVDKCGVVESIDYPQLEAAACAAIAKNASFSRRPTPKAGRFAPLAQVG